MNYNVYFTDNLLGNTWVPFNNGLPNVRINELEINTADNKINAATYGRGLWRSNTYSSVLGVDDIDFKAFTIYPNPSENLVNLKWNSSDDVERKLFNTLGKLMYYNRDLNLQNGLEIDLSPYKSGLYFVKLNSNKGQIIKKLIVN